MKNMTLRLPDDLYIRARRLAETERRSLHAQLLKLIEKGLECSET